MSETSHEARDEDDAEPLAEAPVRATVELVSLPLSLRDLDGLKRGETVVTTVDADAPPALRANGQLVGRLELGVVDGKLAFRLLPEAPRRAR